MNPVLERHDALRSNGKILNFQKNWEDWGRKYDGGGASSILMIVCGKKSSDPYTKSTDFKPRLKHSKR